MQESSRYESAIRLCSSIIDNTSKPSDVILNQFFRGNNFCGSKDRRFISDFVYKILRHINGFFLCNVNATTREIIIAYLLCVEQIDDNKLNQIFNGAVHGPKPIDAAEMARIKHLLKVYNSLSSHKKQGFATWIYDKLFNNFENDTSNILTTLNEEAPFDIRVNTSKLDRDSVMEQLMEYNPEKTKISPYGIRFRKRFNIDTLPLFKKGIIEVQEEGSQLVALAIQVKETDCVLDLCAGALGKTLMLSDLMQNKGKIIATDISDTRLEKGKKRLKRARVSNVSILRSQEFERKFEQRFKQSPYFDCILIDAPCSGTGTWRRHPEMKMRFAQSDLKKLIAVQRSLLLKALPLLKKGGKIIYATCSLLPDENQENIEWFLDKTHATFEMLESDNLNPKFFYTKGYYQFNPYTHETDGFFISILKKKDSRDIS